MSEERPTAGTTSEARDAWKDLGKQLEELGRTVAEAVRVTLESEENKRRLEALRLSANRMASEIGKAIEEAVESEEGHKVLSEVERAAASARYASQQAYDDAMPHVVAALREVSAELQKLSNRMETKPPSDAAPGATDQQEL